MNLTSLLRTPIPPAQRAEWAEHLARPAASLDESGSVILIFRLGSERFALPIESVGEIAPAGIVRPLPHGGDGLIRGITNIRGQIRLCLRLERLLQVVGTPRDAQTTQTRWLVLAHDGWIVAAGVDEVLGAESVTAADRQPLPSTHSGSVYGEAWLEKWEATLLNAPAFFTGMRQQLR